MEKAFKSYLRSISIKDSFSTAKRMVPEYLSSPTATFMMDSGLMASRTAVVSIWIQRLESSTAENGNRVRRMAKDISSCRTKNITTAHLSRALRKDTGLKCLSTEINIRANIKMANSMEKESTYGLMVLATKDSSKKE